MTSREIEHTAAIWLARRDGAEWTERDQQALDAWLDASVANRVAFVRLDAGWRQSRRLTALGAGLHDRGPPARGSWPWSPAASIDAAVQSPRRMTSGGGVRRRRPSAHRAHRVPWRALFLGFSATALVILAVTVAQGWRRNAVEQSSYRTAVGDLREVPLADGSRVTLSSDSRIVVTLSRSERDVDLQQGEAFFAVAKDSRRPFVVTAGGRKVSAVGTRFSVRRDSSDLRVVVTEGLVRLEASPRAGLPHQAITLLPAGSVALAGDNGVVVHSGSVQQARDQLSWRSGFLSFHDTPLAAAVADFNRYNTGKIVIDDEEVGAIRIGGNFRWSNTDAFVRLLTQGFPVKATRRGDTVVLSRR